MVEKSKQLILITQNYPYYPGEQFIETEIKYLSKAFDKVHVIPAVANLSNKCRDVPDNVQVHTLPTTQLPKSLGKALRFISDRQSMRWFRYDYARAKTYGHTAVLTLINWLGLAVRMKRFLDKQFLKNNDASYVFYSYWLSPSAIALAMLNESNGNTPMTVFSRAHGGDLYEERHSPAYIPLQVKTTKELTGLFLISENGYNYMLKKDRELASQLHISRLGTLGIDGKKLSAASKDGTIRIVSCSYLKPVKRVGLIIEALGKCKSRIHWTHIGDGPMMDDLMKKANTLPKHVQWEFLGQLNNQDILTYYKAHPVDFFLNVSESEGIPVTFMEAMSCSIPVMATDVGGVSEIVDETNGMLLDKNITADILAAAVEDFSQRLNNEAQAIRLAAYHAWQQNYDADKNYQDFSRKLKSLGI